MKTNWIERIPIENPPIESLTVTLSVTEARILSAALATTSKGDMEAGYRHMGFDISEVEDAWLQARHLLSDFREALK